jgi:transposase-like protein
MTNLTDPIFTDANKAREHLEALHWPDGPVCPHCGVVDQATLVKGKSHRPGMYQCNACREPFTVTVGTVMEKSHIPLNKWVLGFHLMAASKKGVSAHQLHRTLGITYKSAWFMAHRIREAMTDDGDEPLGGKGKIVEADETFIGPARDVFVTGRGWQKERGTSSKRKVMTLVERGGRSRSFKVDQIDAPTVRKVLFENIVQPTRLMTDEAHHYRIPGRFFGSHERVNHSEQEYARGDVTTNTVEGFFSIFKRGMLGIYQHCDERHLHRYLVEFDFRYSHRSKLGYSDTARAAKAMQGAIGKRLTYRALA